MLNQAIDFMHEDAPPFCRRAQALPYPDLQRVWTRVELTPFSTHPDLEMVILGPDGTEEASMVMVEVRHTYISLTMHLRRSPQPDQTYWLMLRLTRDGRLLDQREIPFPLTFVERDEAKAEAESVLWTERDGPIRPLESERDG